MKYEGYLNKFLEIDLNNCKSKLVHISPSLIENYVGGKGFGVKLFLDLIPPKTDPLSSENVLMFLTGPLTGTLAPATRSMVVTKSPLTGIWLDSYYGGFFGQEIKYTGYDGIIIKGKAPEMTYLYIEDDNIKFRDATFLISKTVSETGKLIRKNERDKNLRIAAIGPAGENLVKYSIISCDFNRQAGRGGAGAVMGSKNLKAIAVKGSNLVGIADKRGFLDAVNKAYNELSNSPSIQAFTQDSTVSSIPFAQEIGMLPTRNYYGGQFEGADKLSPEFQRNLFWYRNYSCSSCPISCGKIGTITSGKYKGLTTDTIEYESVALLGANLAIDDMREVTKIGYLCDELGLDTISAGGSIGFAIEAKNKGLLNEALLKNIELEYGNVETVIKMIKNISYRESEIGNLLAEGVQRASKLIKGSKDFAVHIKGLETPAWPPRGAPGMGLALMTADRGGCHQRAFPVSYEVTDEKWKGKTVKRLALGGKAAMVVELQNNLAALDTFIKCDFGTYGIKTETYIEILNTLTGLDYDVSSLMKLGDKIWDITRLININEGLNRKDDYLPPRFVNEPLPDGPVKGHKISKKDMDLMLDEYYSIRGWDENGIPKKEKFNKLNLEFK